MPALAIKEESHIINIAIFASGAGSNAQRIIHYFRNSGIIKINLVVCNKPSAYVLKIAAEENILSLLIEKENFFNGDNYLPQLQKNDVGFIVLAGFLWKIPKPIIKAYPNKIINIHPALLPKYGGKNMYGNYIHEAAINSRDKKSGISIHYVDEEYDNGALIFQKECDIDKDETVETLAKKIHSLEYEYYAPVIERVINTEIINKN